MTEQGANTDTRLSAAPRAPSFLPAIAMTAALGFLGIGAYIGFRRPIRKHNDDLATEAVNRKVPVKPIAPSVLLSARIPNSELGTGALAAKALLYGTLLCGAGALCTAVVISYTLDVKNVRCFRVNASILLVFIHVQCAL